MIYLAIPPLILIVILSVRLLIRIFKGVTILEIKARYGAYAFEIRKTGFYSLWIYGKLFKKLPLTMFNAAIINPRQGRVRLIPSVFRAQSTTGTTSTMQLKYCYLKEGTYTLLVEQTSEEALNRLDKIIDRVTGTPAEQAFGYRIKKTLPEFLFPLALAGILGPPLIIASLLVFR